MFKKGECLLETWLFPTFTKQKIDWDNRIQQVRVQIETLSHVYMASKK